MCAKNFEDLTRRKNFKPLRKNFLIVCEGEKTEPNYFKKFRVPKEVFDVVGIGANTESLVRKAIELKKKASMSYDDVWCVFDRDSFPAKNFNNALALAKKNNIKIAYSNEAFEIWYLLHFYYHDSATSRADYGNMLTARLGFQYKKNDDSMYDNLIALQKTAIANAAKLLKFYAKHSPSKDNPSTTVHILVKELNKHSV